MLPEMCRDRLEGMCLGLNFATYEFARFLDYGFGLKVPDFLVWSVQRFSVSEARWG